MDRKDSKKSIFDKIKSLWNSLPGAVRFIGTLLGIIIAIKALIPAAVMDINHFGASPDVIAPGDTSILSWEVSGANGVAIEPGIGVVSSNGSLSVSPSQTTTYKLTISGKGADKTASCTVTVKNNSPLITSFDASPNSIKAGESTVLKWHVADASRVTIEPDIGAVEPTGTSSLTPVRTTTYKLTASNGDKKDTAYCTVIVEGNLISAKDEIIPENNSTSQKDDLTIPQGSLTSPQDNPVSAQDNMTSEKTNLTQQGSLPTIDFFNANPDVVSNGESSNLSWSVSTANKISIEPGIGAVGLTGSQRIFPIQNTTYTLIATNEFGNVNATKVLYVQEPVASSFPSSTPTPPPSPASTSATPESATQVSSNTLPAPIQLLPANGMVFDNSTTGTTLEWRAVSGAANYTVEIDSYDSTSNSWLSESGGSNVITGIKTNSYSFKFPDRESGRWRVWAMSPDGQEGKKSDWENFNYTI